MKQFLTLKGIWRDKSWIVFESVALSNSFLLSLVAAEMCMNESPDARKLRVCDWVTHTCNQSCHQAAAQITYETEPVTSQSMNLCCVVDFVNISNFDGQ